MELAARGLGDAGRVLVPKHVWGDWADPEFGGAGGRVHPLPPSRCQRVAALLSTLASQGLVSMVGGDANAELFVKWKSERKCALILNMKMSNKGCKYKARPFQLLSMEGSAVLLRNLGGRGGGAGGGGLWGTKLDSANCYWSVELPPPPPDEHHPLAAQGHTYAFLRVLFGWHQAPGLIEALISDLLRDLGRGGGGGGTVPR